MPIAAKDVVPFTQARANLSELADEVKEGHEKVITKNGESHVALIDADRLDYYHRLPGFDSSPPSTVVCFFPNVSTLTSSESIYCSHEQYFSRDPTSHSR